jgi:hypothetical protein
MRLVGSGSGCRVPAARTPTRLHSGVEVVKVRYTYGGLDRSLLEFARGRAEALPFSRRQLRPRVQRQRVSPLRRWDRVHG